MLGVPGGGGLAEEEGGCRQSFGVVEHVDEGDDVAADQQRLGRVVGRRG